MLRTSLSKEMLSLAASKLSKIMMKSYSVPNLLAKELILRIILTLLPRVFNMTLKILLTKPSE